MLKSGISTNLAIPKFRYIDALRGIAVLGVLLTHTQKYGTNGYNYFFQSLLDFGTLGVQLFYIVSALTLCLSFEKHQLVDPYPIRSFFIRRFFRIAPLFYLNIVASLLVFHPVDRFWMHGLYPITPLNIIASLTFLNGLSPFWINAIYPGIWSIAVESTFYIFFPFIFSKINSLAKALWACLAVALIAQFFRLVLQHFNPIANHSLWTDYLYSTFPSQLSVFLIGICLYQLMKVNQAKRPFDVSKYFNFIRILIIIVLAHLIAKNILAFHFIVSIFWGALVFVLSLNPIRVFVNNFTVFLGKISFSLYLTHFFVLYYFEKFNFIDFVPQHEFNFVIRFALLLIISTILSTVTYYLVELPGQALGKKILSYTASSSVVSADTLIIRT